VRGIDQQHISHAVAERLRSVAGTLLAAADLADVGNVDIPALWDISARLANELPDELAGALGSATM
jgi:hypothetical protein